MNNSFLQMTKKMFFDNLNVSYSFYISKVKIILITWLHMFYTKKQTELFQQLLKFDIKFINTFKR